jgi:hypothetical protein
MANRSFEKGHNILVNLDVNERGAERFEQILTYLARSRIRFAITESPPLNKELLTQFWTNILYDGAANPPTIRTMVNQHPISFTADDLRQLLQLGTSAQEAGPPVYSADFIEGALGRTGYSGPRRGRQFVKAFVLGQWRFLFTVIVSIFGNKKSGLDELSPELMSAVLSLVYNKPYSFSSYIFQSFRGQITGAARTLFILYPRFCMLLIRAQVPNLPAYAADFQVETIGLRGYNACFLLSKRKDEIKPEAADLFGHLLDADYVAPPNNGWMDAGAQGQAQPQPPQAQPQPQSAAESQELIEDALHQVEHQGQQVVPELAAEVLHEVLIQIDDETDPLLRDIDSYVAQSEVIL